MVFVPKFKKPSDSRIIENILALVQRDFKPAVDWFNLDTPAHLLRYGVANEVGASGQDLPDFVQRTLGRFFKVDYPTFAIDPGRNGPDQNADGSYVDQNFRVNLFVAVSNADGPTTEQLAMKYMGALESVLRSATSADYFAGFPANTAFGLVVELSYEYGLLGKNATAYEKPVSVELSLKFETR